MVADLKDVLGVSSFLLVEVGRYLKVQDKLSRKVFCTTVPILNSTPDIEVCKDIGTMVVEFFIL